MITHKFKIFFRFLASFVCALSLTSTALAQAIMIDITNPKFRKLITAVPSFETSSENAAESANLTRLAKIGSDELKRLLVFSGYFQIIEEAAYRDLLQKPKVSPPASNLIAGFEGINLVQWKNVGVELLILAKLSKTPQSKIRLELRAADAHRGERILAKAYTLQTDQDLEVSLKLYVDRLLMRYTGRPGIFSSRIVFIGRKTRGSNKQVFSCDIDGHNVKQITFDGATHLSPSWSPDGQKILFTALNKNTTELFMQEFPSNKLTKIAAYDGINSGGVFSPNGKLIAFTSSVARGNTDIFVSLPQVSTRNANPRQAFIQGNGISVDPSFSPDGKWFAFVSGRFGNPHIFRVQLKWNGDTKVEKLSEQRLTYAGWFNATPAWSPDSSKIAFAGFDKDVNRFDLFLMNHDGTNLERLTLSTADNESPTWSPNGQLIIFHSNRVGQSNVKGVSQLYIMSRDGSNQRLIETGLYDAQTPKWGPNLIGDD